MVQSIKEVLMQRDEMSEHEAEEKVEEVQGIIQEAATEYDANLLELEEIVKDELGLEPDYLDEILFKV